MSGMLVVNSDVIVDSIISSLVIIFLVCIAVRSVVQVRSRIIEVRGWCGRRLELVEEHIWGGRKLLYVDSVFFLFSVVSIVVTGVLDWWYQDILGIDLGVGIFWGCCSVIFVFLVSFLVINFYTEKRLKMIKKLLEEDEVGELDE